MTPVRPHDPDSPSPETATEQAAKEQPHGLTNLTWAKGLFASGLLLLTLSLSGAYVVNAGDAPEPIALVIWLVFCMVISFGYIQFLMGDLGTVAERYRRPLKVLSDFAEFFASFLYWR